MVHPPPSALRCSLSATLLPQCYADEHPRGRDALRVGFYAILTRGMRTPALRSSSKRQAGIGGLREGLELRGRDWSFARGNRASREGMELRERDWRPARGNGGLREGLRWDAWLGRKGTWYLILPAARRRLRRIRVTLQRCSARIIELELALEPSRVSEEIVSESVRRVNVRTVGESEESVESVRETVERVRERLGGESECAEEESEEDGMRSSAPRRSAGRRVTTRENASARVKSQSRARGREAARVTVFNRRLQTGSPGVRIQPCHTWMTVGTDDICEVYPDVNLQPLRIPANVRKHDLCAHIYSSVYRPLVAAVAARLSPPRPSIMRTSVTDANGLRTTIPAARTDQSTAHGLAQLAPADLTPGLRQMLGALLGIQLPSPGASDGGPATDSALDPEVLKVSRQAQLEQDLADIKAKKRTREDSDNEADNEDSDADNGRFRNPSKRSRNRKKAQKSKFTLNVKMDGLNRKQLDTRIELQKLLRLQLENLTGRNKNGFLRKEDAPEDGADTPATDEPAAEDDPEAPIARAPRTRLLPLDFEEDVDYGVNRKALSRTVQLIWTDQGPDSPTRDLENPDVEFTIEDLHAFSKVIYRGWRRHYQAANDEVKAEKMRKHRQRARRVGRRSQLKAERTSAVDAYKAAHSGKDPTPLLESDWMSEYISQLSDSEDEKVNRALLVTAAELSAKDITKKVVVWEVVKQAFRSDQLTAVYDELDRLREVVLAEQLVSRATVRRAFKGRSTDDVPRLAIFPFMRSAAWYDRVVKGDKVLMKALKEFEDDPEGFQVAPSGDTLLTTTGS
ncbi:hypothetical protein PLICRDRAFT_29187 [Plicaturopsis crispa FD-325 SS-3]|nr:hypothetical protein PLICRDRAFT_29187 [Plicaturopsis crispa FD-325 SS-3]